MTSDVFDPSATVEQDLFDSPAQDFYRDHHRRPLIKVNGELVPHVSVTTLAGLASSSRGLDVWRGRHIALATAAHQDIAACIAGMQYGDRRLDQFIEAAIERAKMSEKANWGTAVHRWTEPNSPDNVYASLNADVLSYALALKRTGLVVVGSEIDCVNPELVAAGTLDHLYLIPDGTTVTFYPGTPEEVTYDIGGNVIVGDKKTGRLHREQVEVQLAVYANSVRWDVENNCAGGPIHPKLDPRVGINIRIPLGEGLTTLDFLDLVTGYEIAKAIRLMHRRLNIKGASIPVPVIHDDAMLDGADFRDDIAGESAQAMPADPALMRILEGAPANNIFAEPGPCKHPVKTEAGQCAVCGECLTITLEPTTFVSAEEALSGPASIEPIQPEDLAPQPEPSPQPVNGPVEPCAEHSFTGPRCVVCGVTVEEWAAMLRAKLTGKPAPARKGTGRKCGLCKQSGHNARTCPTTLPADHPYAQPIPTQEQAPQPAPEPPQEPSPYCQGCGKPWRSDPEQGGMWVCAGCGKPSQATLAAAQDAQAYWRGRIRVASSPKELSVIWQEATGKGEWNDDLKTLGMARLAELDPK